MVASAVAKPLSKVANALNWLIPAGATANGLPYEYSGRNTGGNCAGSGPGGCGGSPTTHVARAQDGAPAGFDRDPVHEGNSVKVAVCDYRAGNIRSVEIALRRLGAELVDDVAGADLAVLPGVGAARSAMDELRRRFGIDGGDDDVTPVRLELGWVYVGLPMREGGLLGELLKAGEIGYELSLDPRTPIVIGIYPMRPIPRS